jgi:hypothetical protein
MRARLSPVAHLGRELSADQPRADAESGGRRANRGVDDVRRGNAGLVSSHGIGGVAGIGMEYYLTRTFSLTTEGSLMRSRMTAHDLANTPATVPGFAMTAFRYTIGLKYNPVRLVLPSASDRP